MGDMDPTTGSPSYQNRRYQNNLRMHGLEQAPVDPTTPTGDWEQDRHDLGTIDHPTKSDPAAELGLIPIHRGEGPRNTFQKNDAPADLTMIHEASDEFRSQHAAELVSKYLKNQDDPLEGEALVNLALFMRDEFGVDPAVTMRNPEQIIENWTGKKQPAISGWQAIKDKWDTGNLIVERARVGGQLLFDPLNPELIQSYRDLEAQMPPEDSIKRSVPVWMLKELAEALPFTMAIANEGMQAGVVAGATWTGMAAIAGNSGPQAMIPEEGITIPTGAIIASTIAWRAASFKEAAYLTAGSIMGDLMTMEDENGNTIDPVIGQAAALTAGALSGGLELLSLDNIFGGNSLLAKGLRKAAPQAVKNLVARGAFRQIAWKFTTNYTGAVGQEVLTELMQEIVETVGSEAAKITSNAFGDTMFDPMDIEEALETGKQVVTKTLGASGLMVLPGSSIATARDIRTQRDQRTRLKDEPISHAIATAPQEELDNILTAAAEVRNIETVTSDNAAAAKTEDGTSVGSIEFDIEGDGITITSAEFEDSDNGELAAMKLISDLARKNPKKKIWFDESIEQAPQLRRALEDMNPKLRRINSLLDAAAADRDQLNIETQELVALDAAYKSGKTQEDLDADLTPEEVTERLSEIGDDAYLIGRNIEQLEAIRSQESSTDLRADWAKTVGDYRRSKAAGLDADTRAEATLGIQVKMAMPKLTEKQVSAAVAITKTVAQSQGLSLADYLDTYFDPDVVKHDSAVALAGLAQGAGVAKGATTFLTDGKAIIRMAEAADFSTWVHELAHVFRQHLTPDQEKIILDWAGEEKWTTKAEEDFAKGFEQYLRNGNAPSLKMKAIFDQLAEFVRQVYRNLKSALVELTPEVEQVYSELLGEKENALSNAHSAKTLTKNGESGTNLDEQLTLFQMAPGHWNFAKKHGFLDAYGQEMIERLATLTELDRKINKEITGSDELIQEAEPEEDIDEDIEEDPDEAAELIDDDSPKMMKVKNLTEVNRILDEFPEFVQEIRSHEEFFGTSVLDENNHLIGSPIEERLMVKKSGAVKGMEYQTFHNFLRNIAQTYLDRMPAERFEKFRQQMVASIEFAFNNQEKLNGNEIKMLRKSPKNFDSKFSVQQVLRKAHKTVAALNLNSQCPMFNIGARGCYLDGCYVTAMGAGASAVNYYVRAMYTGEILQLSDENVKHLNDIGGLRLNGAGDLSMTDLAQMQDIIRHAAMRGLKLKVITKQESTIAMIHELQQSEDGKTKWGAMNNIIVQTTVDPYYVDMESDNYHGSGAEPYAKAVNKALEEGDIEKMELLQEEAIKWYKSMGYDAKIIDGRVFRKYGFSSSQIQEIARKYPGVKIQVRSVVGTPKEIAEYALHTPEILQTWMHAAIKGEMYSDVEGRVLQTGEIGNYTARIAVEKQDGEWRILAAQTSKANSPLTERAVYTATEQYIKDNYSAEEQEKIFKVLSGQLEGNPSALCCSTGASRDACNDCASLCQSGSFLKAESLENLAATGGERTLFQGDVNRFVPAAEGGNLEPATWAALEMAGYKASDSTGTQITTTRNTYEKIAAQAIDKSERILDFAAGLGHGTKVLRDQGYTIDGYEPFSQEEKRAIPPDFTQASDIPSDSYDVVINNAVLNVVPEETRVEILEDIYRVLKPGGRAYIQVMGWGNIKPRMENPKTKIVGPREIITGKGTFQKGYTQADFPLFIQSVLPEAIIERSPFGDVKAVVRKPAEQTLFQTAPPIDSQEFKDWFRDSKVVDENGDPLVVYHGTTHVWDVADIDRTNTENDMGRGIYATNTPEDSGRNYAGEGPDLTNRIERLAESLQDDDVDYEEAFEIARAQLKGSHDGAVMPLYMSLQNPVILGGDDRTFLDAEYEYDEDVDEYGEPSGLLVDFIENLREAASEYDLADPEESIGKLYEMMADGGAYADEVIGILKEDMGLADAMDDDGNFGQSEIIRKAFLYTGFDGVIDHTVDSKFGSSRVYGKSMDGVNPGTVHYIAWDPKQLKSATGNTGAYSTENPSILYQTDPEHEAGVRSALGQGINVPDEVLEEYADRPWAQDELKKRRAEAHLDLTFSWLDEAIRDFSSYSEFEKWFRETWAFNSNLSREEGDYLKRRWQTVAGKNEVIAWKAQWDRPAIIKLLTDLSQDPDKARGFEIHETIVAAAERIKAGEAISEKLESRVRRSIQSTPEVNRLRFAEFYGDADEISAARAAVDEVEGRAIERAVLTTKPVDRAAISRAIKALDDDQKPESEYTLKNIGEMVNVIDGELWRANKRVQQLEASLEKAKEEKRVKIKEAIRKERERKRTLEEKRKKAKQLRNLVLKLARFINRPVPKNVDLEYREQIEAIQAGIDPKFRTSATIKKWERRREYFESHPEEMDLIGKRLQDKLYQKHLNDFSVDELQKIANQVQHLLTIGKTKYRLKRQLEDNRIQAIIDQVVEELTQGGPIKVTDGEPILGKNISMKDKAWEAYLVTLTPERLMDFVDGRQDFSGPFHRVFVDEVNEAKAEKIRKRNERIAKVKKVMAENDITVNDLAKIRDVSFNGKTYKASLDQILKIWANMLNERNRAAMVYGNFGGVRDSFSMIHTFINKLSQKEINVARAILEDYDENFDRLSEAHTSLTNERLQKEHNYSPLGRMEHDYSPNPLSLADEMSQVYGIKRGRVADGMVKARIEIAPDHQKPINMDGLFSEWMGALEKQEHYINLSKPVMTMRRILRNRDFSTALTSYRPKATMERLRFYVDRVANPSIMWSNDPVSRFVRNRRKMFALAVLGYNTKTIQKQIPSLLYYVSESSPQHILGAIAQLTSDWGRWRKFIEDLDPLMTERSTEREIEALKRAKNEHIMGIVDKIGWTGMKGIMAADKLATSAGWLAVYNWAIDKGMSPEEAARRARNATLRTQPSSDPENVAEIQTREIVSLFSMFQNQVIKIWNTTTYDGYSHFKNGHVIRGFQAYAGVLLGNALLWILTQQELPDDKEDWTEMLVSFMNIVPIVGPMITTSMKYMDSSSALEAPFQELGHALATKDWKKKVINIMEAAAYVVGFPIVQVKREIRGAKEGLNEFIQYTIFGGTWGEEE